MQWILAKEPRLSEHLRRIGVWKTWARLMFLWRRKTIGSNRQNSLQLMGQRATNSGQPSRYTKIRQLSAHGRMIIHWLTPTKIHRSKPTKALLTLFCVMDCLGWRSDGLLRLAQTNPTCSGDRWQSAVPSLSSVLKGMIMQAETPDPLLSITQLISDSAPQMSLFLLTRHRRRLRHSGILNRRRFSRTIRIRLIPKLGSPITSRSKQGSRWKSTTSMEDWYAI